jgi:hypothetical protein
MSVMQKATRLQALARTYAEGEAHRRSREQAAAALSDVEEALAGLVDVAEAARAAARAGVPLPDLDGLLARGLSNLEAKAVTEGLPNRQALQAAKNAITKSRTELEATVLAAWREWAGARAAGLPREKAVLLDRTTREGVENDLRVLTDLARSMPRPGGLTAGTVNRFVAVLERVRARLDAVRSDDPVVALLGRLDQSGGLVLADLSDDDLALLRSRAGVAAQLVLRRRP